MNKMRLHFQGGAIVMRETYFKLSDSSGALGLHCAARGVDRDMAGVTAGLVVVARALNAGDTAKAMTAAVLLRLPDLDWNGAVRIAQADEALRKYSEDQPRDWHGRWTDGDADGPAAIPAPHRPSAHRVDAGALETNVTAPGDPSPADVVDRARDPFALPADWIHLPPGERIDELADLAEWIANAKPKDEVGIRADIERLFYDVGDGQGGKGISEFLDDALKPGITLEERQNIIDALDHFTRTDPGQAARFTGLINTIIASGTALLELPGALYGAISSIGEAAAVASDVWKLGWAARGFAIEEALGSNLARNFPVIDRFFEGVATSIKSIDLNASTYQDAARLTYRVNAYVDKVAGFDGAEWGEDAIQSKEIIGRVLNVAIPKGSVTAVQQTALQAAQTRAKALGVHLIVTPF